MTIESMLAKGGDYERFIRDMVDAGLSPHYYVGRNFWRGPAVIVSRVSDCTQHTSVPCQHDSMGHECVVYPKKNLA